MNSSLADLYQIEYEQHSKTLLSGYRVLCESGATQDGLNELMRAAHSLKGAARLVGKTEIAATSHSLEALVKSLPLGSVDQTQLNELHTQLEKLGLRADSLRGDCAPSMCELPTQALLHVTPSQISNLIHLSSDLAVSTRRLYAALETKGESTASTRSQSEAEIERLYSLAHALQQATYDLRLVRLGEITRSLEQIVLATASATQKNVSMRVVNGSALVDRQLISILEPCLIQIIKNSVDHGIERAEQRITRSKNPQGRITIAGRQLGANLQIIVSDDGAGIDFERIRTKVVQRGHHSSQEAEKLSSEELIEFLFLPGFSTKDEVSEFSGRGIGLDIVRSRLSEIGGSIRLESVQGISTTFTLSIPSQIASFRSLIFTAGCSTLAVPLAYVERVMSLEEVRFVELEGYVHAMVDELEVPILGGEELCGNNARKCVSQDRSLIILNAAGKRKALRVDRLLGEEETVLKRLDQRFEKQSKILGTSVGRDNAIVSILNVESLMADPIAKLRANAAPDSSSSIDQTEARILVVDDSLTVRELERRILISAGYSCEAAVDGVDGLQKLRDNSFDLIVTDIDMPRLNGFDFISEVRKGAVPGAESLPIIVVSYKERSADRAQAQSLGANDFLSKGSFKDQSFISTVNSLLKSSIRKVS